MGSSFELLVEEFEENLDSLEDMLSAFDAGAAPLTRVAAANAGLLLLAAVFEEFVRGMAEGYARAVVERAGSRDKLPPKFATEVWKRSLGKLSKIDLHSEAGVDITEAGSRLAAVLEFCIKGDLSQEVYVDLVHNEANMRPNQLNALFRVSGFSDACRAACIYEGLQLSLGAPNAQSASGLFVARLEDFFERRNEAAHAIGLMNSSSTNVVMQDAELLRQFAFGLREAMEVQLTWADRYRPN